MLYEHSRKDYASLEPFPGCYRKEEGRGQLKQLSTATILNMSNYVFKYYDYL